MSAAIKIFAILISVSLNNVDAQSLSEKRIFNSRQNVKRIERQLVGIEDRDYVCNGTIYEVIDKMENVSSRIKQLYRGPFIAKMDLSSGYTNKNTVLMKVPDPVVACIQSLEGTAVTQRYAHSTCIRQLLWKYEFPENERTIRSDQRIVSNYGYKAKLDAYNEARNNYTTPPLAPVYSNQQPSKLGRALLMLSSPSPTPSFSSTMSTTPAVPLRVRKEYRTLTLAERTRFHNALQVLYKNGKIRRFARIHRRGGTHGGPGFLPWHRAFITNFENALQEVDSSVTLPYWDSSLDDQMSNPIASINWSHDYLGNGAGQVVTGPFANWDARRGKLERYYGLKGKLVSKLNMNRVMTRCKFQQISPPTGRRNFKIESFHNSVHVWVGGDMTAVSSAAHDPVFYLHHCFIDYIWEKFRERQRDICGEDPETDYIEANGRHNIDSTMAQMREYTIRDGLSNFWTSEVFRYEDTPSCNNNCGGSDVLECDGHCCIPKSRFETEEDMTTTPLFSPTSTSSERQRRQVEQYTNKVNTENGTQRDNGKESSDTCDRYIDPDCLTKEITDLGKQKKPIPLSIERQLIGSMVPENRGPEFVAEPSEESDRTLFSFEEDETSYQERLERMRAKLQAEAEAENPLNK